MANSGYPKVNIWMDGKQQTVSVHRLAYLLWKGPIRKGLVVAHNCHRARCIRPEHLEAITQKENIAQMNERKKRMRNFLDTLKFVPSPRELELT